MFSELSSDVLFSRQHLDSNLLPPRTVPSRVINALRRRQIIKYLEKPLDKLLPDPNKYGTTYAEVRKLEEDTEKRKAEAGQA